MTRRKDNAKSGKTHRIANDPIRQLPTITHLQFLALDLLVSSPQGVAAQSLKTGISQLAPDYGGAKFYQLMGRLNTSGLITSDTMAIDVAGSHVLRTFYSISPLGVSAWNDTIAFYLDRVGHAKGPARRQ